MAAVRSLAKIRFFVHGRHGPRGCAAFRILRKKFRLIREIRVPTDLISDFAQAMILHGFNLEFGTNNTIIAVCF
jgi:hypothetical protein